MKVTQDLIYAKLIEVSTDVGSLKTNVDLFHDRLTEHAAEDAQMAVRIGNLETSSATIAQIASQQAQFAAKALDRIASLEKSHNQQSGMVKGLAAVGTAVGAGLGVAASWLAGKH